MFVFVVRRLIGAVIMLAVITLIVFAIFFLLPRLAGMADQYALVRSVSHNNHNHTPMIYYTLTGRHTEFPAQDNDIRPPVSRPIQQIVGTDDGRVGEHCHPVGHGAIRVGLSGRSGTVPQASLDGLQVGTDRPRAETTTFDIWDDIRAGGDDDLVPGLLRCPSKRQHR